MSPLFHLVLELQLFFSGIIVGMAIKGLKREKRKKVSEMEYLPPDNLPI